MHPRILRHPKLVRLCQMLGEPVPHVVGYLELLHHAFHTEGSVIRTGRELEAAAQYPGSPGKLHRALVECQLVEGTPDGLHAQDFLAQKPEYALSRERMRRLRTQQRNGMLFSLPPKAEKTATPAPQTPAPEENMPPIPDTLDCPEFQVVWAEWLDHRRKMRKKVTPYGARMQLRRLAQMGVERAIRAIRYSMAQGYEGIFEERHERKYAETRKCTQPNSRVRTEDAKLRAVESKVIRSSGTSHPHGPHGPNLASHPENGSRDRPHTSPNSMLFD